MPLVKHTSSFIQHSLGSRPGFHRWNRCKDLTDMQLLWFMEEISWLVVMSIGKCTLILLVRESICSISAFFRLAVLSTLSVLSSLTLLLLLCTFPYFTCKLSLFSESWMVKWNDLSRNPLGLWQKEYSYMYWESHFDIKLNNNLM